MERILARLLEVERRTNTAYVRLAAMRKQLAELQQNQHDEIGVSGSALASPYMTLGLYPAKTGGGGIAAKSGSTPGAGDVTLYELNPVDSTSASGATVRVFNWFTTAVGASKDIYVGRYVNAAGVQMWVVPSESC